MKFNKPDTFLLFGGSDALARAAERLVEKKIADVCVYTCERQLHEPLSTGESLEDALRACNVEYHSTEDINRTPGLRERITPASLGIGFGEAWSFDADIIRAFGGSLLDLMGIRLPQYRGGAHYSWQILTGNRMGACNLQVINEDMVQGRVDTGRIVKFREYLFPATARIPKDYFAHAVRQEIDFIMEFIDEVAGGKEFSPFPLQENFSLFMPRLNTIRQAFIDWSWSTEELDRFICAFDDPYAGAATMIDDVPVRLKSSRFETNDGPFHPFQCGLVYKKYGHALYIASRNGTLIVEKLLDGDGRDILDTVQVGQRLYTPASLLEQSMLYSADYNASGVRE